VSRLRSLSLGLRPSGYDPTRRRGTQVSGVGFQVSALPLVRIAAIEIQKETEFVHEGKLQITSTKLQANHWDLFEIWDL